jgi:hypothetical protein
MNALVKFAFGVLGIVGMFLFMSGGIFLATSIWGDESTGLPSAFVSALMMIAGGGLLYFYEKRQHRQRARTLTQSKDKATPVKGLAKQGSPESAAPQSVDNLDRDSPEGRKVLAGKNARRMIYGFLWAVGGTVVTVATYEAASAGETYVVAWGAILVGIIEIFRGLFGWIKYRS